MNDLQASETMHSPTIRMLCEKAIAYVQPAPTEAELAHAHTDPLGGPVFRAIAPGLVVSYLIDDADDYRYIQQNDLRAAEMSPEEIDRIALQNLAALAKEKNPRGVCRESLRGAVWRVL